MAEHELTMHFSNEGTRNEVRMRVIAQFSQEEPGIGKKDDASKYNYYVETINGGIRIYLKRPANLHNGFDYVVCVEEHNFADPGGRARNYPTHDNIVSDLMNKRDENPGQYNRLYSLITQIYQCSNVTDDEMRTVTFENGYSAEMILKIIKWLFIEQDIRYWNYSGRAMLWGGIPRPE